METDNFRYTLKQERNWIGEEEWEEKEGTDGWWLMTLGEGYKRQKEQQQLKMTVSVLAVDRTDKECLSTDTKIDLKSNKSMTLI